MWPSSISPLAHLAARAKASAALELLAPVELSICCFRYAPATRQSGTAREDLLNELNRTVLRQVQEGGRSVPSGTELHGTFAIRPCYINPRTSLADVDALVDEVEACGAEVWTAMQARSD